MDGINPLITVVTVVLNAKDHIEQTVLSVINQTYSNIEYIIIDGGSTDGTLDIIRKYEDKITLWKSEPDKGIFDAMNKGIDLATGEWVNFMNAGDFFYTDDILEKIFKNKNIEEEVIYGDHYHTFYIGNNKIPKLIKSVKPEKEFWLHIPGHQACFVKTGIIKQNKFVLNEDYERTAGDIIMLLDFYYNKKLRFKRENKVIASCLGGGVSANSPYEKPYFLPVLKARYIKYKCLSKVLGNLLKIKLYFLLMAIKNIILISLFKITPSLLRYKVFTLINPGR